MKNLARRTTFVSCIGIMIMLIFISMLLLFPNTMQAKASSLSETKTLNYTIHEVADNAGYTPILVFVRLIM